MLNIIDLFSGAGGLTEGFRNKDVNFVAHVEMDKAACKTLKLRECFYYLKEINKLDVYYEFIQGGISYDYFSSFIPEHINSKIINATISKETIPEIFEAIDKDAASNRINGIIGGPPCQAYSTIGRARNEKNKQNDERIYLYEHYLTFLEKYSPDFFCV